jgi:hypothetical protein
MKNRISPHRLFTLTLTLMFSFALFACSGSPTPIAADPVVEPSPSAADDLASTSADLQQPACPGRPSQLRTRLAAMLSGVSSLGGESDPMPLRVMLLPLVAQEALSGPWLVRNAAPLIDVLSSQPPYLRDGELAFQSNGTFAEALRPQSHWLGYADEPLPDRPGRMYPTRWKALRALARAMKAELGELTSVTLGRMRTEGIETGQVAHVLAGTLCGSVILIYAIDTWT